MTNPKKGRTKMLQIRFSEAEIKSVHADMAKHHEVNRSAYIRGRILNGPQISCDHNSEILRVATLLCFRVQARLLFDVPTAIEEINDSAMKDEILQLFLKLGALITLFQKVLQELELATQKRGKRRREE
jgi:hypothetical protein